MAKKPAKTAATDVPKDILDQAKMAELMLEPAEEPAQRFVRSLADETEAHEFSRGRRTRKRTDKGRLAFERTVGAFAGDLIQHASNQESEGFCYRTSSRDEIAATLATSRHFDSLKTDWQEMGLLETRQGFRGTDEFDGAPAATGYNRAARYRATEKLIQYAAEHGIYPDNILELFENKAGIEFPVVLRPGKVGRSAANQGASINFARTDQVKSIANDVKELNEFLNQFEFSVPNPPQLQRIFNNGKKKGYQWNQGGRFYAIGPNNFQTLKKSERARIEIDGAPVCELDVRASHLTIFYGLNRAEFNNRDDPYDPGEYPRELVKKWFVTTFGKGDFPSKWPKGAKDEFFKSTGRPWSGIKMTEMTDHIVRRHPVIERLPSSPLDWSKLQYVEAEIFKSVMLRLMRDRETPSLPVHDSIIIPSSLENVALVTRLIEEEYERLAGIKPIISLPGE
jgi:hypothetical protein